MSDPTRTEWTEGVNRIHAEAQGLLRLLFITPDDAAGLALAALCGNQRATGLLRATADCAANVMRQRHRKKPVLCLCCPRAVRKVEGAIFCFAVPEVDSPERALGSVICPCCVAAPDLHSRAVQALRGVWPDIRKVEIATGSGAVH